MKKRPNFFSVSYDRFSRNAQKDFKLALTVMLALLIYRLFVMFHYRTAFQAQTTLVEYLAAVLNGLRYDAAVAGYITLIPFLTSLVAIFMRLEAANILIRRFFMYLFAFAAGALLASHFLYYMEFHENFSHLAMTILYDDAPAVAKTAWRQYPLGKSLVAAVLCGGLYIYASSKFIRSPFLVSRADRKNRRLISVLKILGYLALFLIMIRGSVGPRPVEPKDGAVTSDHQLNNHVINPFMAMLYAVEDHMRSRSVNGIETFLGKDAIENAVQRYFKTPHGKNLDAMMIHRAPGNQGAPKHVFLIMMESMDAWNLQDKYNSFRLLPNLEALGNQGEGALLKKFLSASSGTMTSLAAIITGLPDAAVVTNYQPSSQKPYPTSIAPQFQQLGYRTRLFYGGYLSWQRIQAFCTDQGIEEVYGGGHMGNWQMKEWGVDDNVLFDFVSKTVEKDPTPSFNIILSTTYHSPYDIDIYKWGFPYKQFPDDLDASQSTVDVGVYGHLWYEDKVVGDFIRNMHTFYPKTLFAVTGDHRSHNDIRSNEIAWERYAVPLLLYGTGVHLSPAQCDQIAGSHLDIGPTLLELSAPPGFVYYSLGSNLLDANREQIGFGRRLAITPSHIITMQGMAEALPFSSAKNPGATGISIDAVAQLSRRIKDHYAIGWWRIMKGPELP